MSEVVNISLAFLHVETFILLHSPEWSGSDGIMSWVMCVRMTSLVRKTLLNDLNKLIDTLDAHNQINKHQIFNIFRLIDGAISFEELIGQSIEKLAARHGVPFAGGNVSKLLKVESLHHLRRLIVTMQSRRSVVFPCGGRREKKYIWTAVLRDAVDEIV